MDVIELTRQLGAAIQQDERYKAYEEARKAAEGLAKFANDPVEQQATEEFLLDMQNALKETATKIYNESLNNLKGALNG